MRPRQTRPRLLQAMIDAFRLPDLRRRILFTFGMLVAFRFIAHVPLPGVDMDALSQVFQRSLNPDQYDQINAVKTNTRARNSNICCVSTPVRSGNFRKTPNKINFYMIKIYVSTKNRKNTCTEEGR